MPVIHFTNNELMEYILSHPMCVELAKTHELEASVWEEDSGGDPPYHMGIKVDATLRKPTAPPANSEPKSRPGFGAVYDQNQTGQ